MLEFKLTPKHAGLALWGDYASLSRTRELVYRLVDESTSIENEEGFVLGLSYDLRKAAEGQRSKGKRSLGGPGDKCTIYGVEILWPVILIQVAILRHAMAFVPTSRLDQAIMFELEHVVVAALRKADSAKTLEDIWQPAGAIHHRRRLRLQWSNVRCNSRTPRSKTFGE